MRHPLSRGPGAGWHGAVAGTRKTTPGLGLLEKYAILVRGLSLQVAPQLPRAPQQVTPTGAMCSCVRVLWRAGDLLLVA